MPAAPDDGELKDLFEHRFYDCITADRKLKGKDQLHNSKCEIFYSAYDDRIAVVLKDPKQALGLPTKIEEDEVVTSLFSAQGDWMNLTPDPEAHPSVAIYKLKGFRKGVDREQAILQLAQRLRSKETKTVETAGAVVRKALSAGQCILVDEVAYLGRGDSPTPPSPTQRALLSAVGFDFVAPDPFDPDHGALLRARYEDKCSQAPPLLAGLDLLTCIAGRAAGEPGEVVDACLADSRSPSKIAPRMQAYFSNTEDQCGVANPELLRNALIAFYNLQPTLVRPTLIPISDPSSAGFGKWLDGEIKKEDQFSAKITFNSTSNSTDTDDKASLSVDATMGRGTYPGQLRFHAGAQVRIDEDEFDEDVTNLLVNYDHYFRPWLEFYGFVQRYSNTYLSIEQRWEGGGGLLFEYDLRRSKEHLDEFCPTRGLGDRGYRSRQVLLTKDAELRMEQYRDKLRTEKLRNRSISKESAEKYCKYVPGISKRNARLQLGLALSAFSDFERPEALKLTAEPVDENAMPVEGLDSLAPVELTPPSSQTLRYSIRPTFTWRPSDRMTLELLYYYKISDDNLEGGGNDWRGEGTFRVDFVLNQGDPMVTLTGNYTRFNNSGPPGFSFETALGEFDLAAADPGNPVSRVGIDAAGQSFLVGGFEAEEDHEVVKFGVTISF